MAISRPASSDGPRPRWRGVITTALMILLAIMIIRDIFVRRFASGPPAATELTRRNP